MPRNEYVSNRGNHSMTGIVALLYVPVNNYGNVETVSQPNYTVPGQASVSESELFTGHTSECQSFTRTMTREISP